jgi:hypothetical protein
MGKLHLRTAQFCTLVHRGYELQLDWRYGAAFFEKWGGRRPSQPKYVNGPADWPITEG